VRGHIGAALIELAPNGEPVSSVIALRAYTAALVVATHEGTLPSGGI
jgi:hypothetical protein